MTPDPLLDSPAEAYADLRTTGAGPAGRLPLTPELLGGMTSGDFFGWTQNAGMGWNTAHLLRRLIRSLPTRRGVLDIATCDKGLPAMLLALAGCRELPAVLVPGGVTLLAEGAEDTARVQTLPVALRAGRGDAGAGGGDGLPCLRFAGRGLPVPGHRRHQPGGGRGARAGAAA